MMLSMEDDSYWDDAVQQLLRTSDETPAGVCALRLPSDVTHIPRDAFQAARFALAAIDVDAPSRRCDDADEETTDASSPSLVPCIPQHADSGHCTGYHPAGDGNNASSAATTTSSLSRYNARRRGFVFSDGQRIHVEGVPDFDTHAVRLFELLHDAILNAMLSALERHLDMPCGWFQQHFGPTRDNSQWHIKEFVSGLQQQRQQQQASSEEPDHSSDVDAKESSPQHQQQLPLPTHTDPSLLSVVIHDRPGCQEEDGAQGLQCYCPVTQTWCDVPRSGHGVAIILVGSLLAHVTAGEIAACRHRVVEWEQRRDDVRSASNSSSRMAATLFGRPAPAARLVLLPSPRLRQNNANCQEEEEGGGGGGGGGPTMTTRMEKTHRRHRDLTFAEWNARVARNYQKSKKHSTRNHLLPNKQTTTSPATPMSSPQTLKEAFERDGFVVVRRVVALHLLEDWRQHAHRTLTSIFVDLHQHSHTAFPTHCRQQIQIEECSKEKEKTEYALGCGVKHGFREVVMRSPGRYEISVQQQQQHLNEKYHDKRDAPPCLDLVQDCLSSVVPPLINGTTSWENVNLLSVSLVISTPSSPAQSWHADGGHLDLHRHLPCHCLNVFVPLTDITADMGPTQFRPGTHFHTRNLGPMMLAAHCRKTLQKPVAPLLQASDILAFDYRILHRGLANTTFDQNRSYLVLTVADATTGFRDVLNFPSRSLYDTKDEEEDDDETFACQQEENETSK